MTSSVDPLVDHQRTLYESRNATRRWLHCSRRDLILSWIERDVPAAGRAMEVGPGSGVYLPALARRFGEVLAVDCEQAYLRNAAELRREFPNITTHVDDITQCSLAGGAVDFILCSEVVEHIARADLAIKEMRRLLKPGGLLLLSTPQPTSLLEITAKIALSRPVIGLTRMVYKESVVDMGHINVMSTKVVRRHASEAGFEILRSHTAGLYVPVIAEFGGSVGAAILRRLDPVVGASFLSGLQWTQFHLMRAA